MRRVDMVVHSDRRAFDGLQHQTRKRVSGERPREEVALAQFAALHGIHAHMRICEYAVTVDSRDIYVKAYI